MQRDKRAWWGFAILLVGATVFTVKGIVIEGVDPFWLLAAHTVTYVSIIIELTPLRGTAAKWLRSPNLGWVTVGLAVITFLGTSTAVIVNNSIGFFLYGAPKDIWPMFFPIVQSQRLTITLGGTIVGLGVIAGLRRLRIVRPTEGGWY